jgi:hypothetical protein
MQRMDLADRDARGRWERERQKTAGRGGWCSSNRRRLQRGEAGGEARGAQLLLAAAGAGAGTGTGTHSCARTCRPLMNRKP